MRIKYLDLAKFVAAYLVTLSHTFQCVSLQGYDNWKVNPFIIFLHVFYMPLFLFISGIFAKNLSKKTVKQFISENVKFLIIPMFCFCLLTQFLPSQQKYSFIYNIFYEYWFVWALLWCKTLFYITNKMKWQYKLLIYLSIYLFIPDIYRMGLYKMSFLFFVSGIYWSQIYSFFIQRKQWIFLIVAFLLCYCFWTEKCYIYNSRFLILGKSANILDNVYYLIFRYIGGFSGSVLLLLLLRKYFSDISNKYIINIGKRTLYIYLCQPFLLDSLPIFHLKYNVCVYLLYACCFRYAFLL
jgi:fucose 4-O-acetylase-like acetyltransferase